MSTFKRMSVLTAVAALLALMLAGPASAAPVRAPHAASATASNTATASTYPPNSGGGGKITISATVTSSGAYITISGSGFKIHIKITFTLHSKTYYLGSTYTNAEGRFSKTVKLPAGVTGHHHIVASGGGKTVEEAIYIKSASSSSGSGSGSSGSGGLPDTGVAVLGIGALGLVLLAGGSALLFAGRRRRVHV